VTADDDDDDEGGGGNDGAIARQAVTGVRSRKSVLTRASGGRSKRRRRFGCVTTARRCNLLLVTRPARVILISANALDAVVFRRSARRHGRPSSSYHLPGDNTSASRRLRVA